MSTFRTTTATITLWMTPDRNSTARRAKWATMNTMKNSSRRS